MSSKIDSKKVFGVIITLIELCFERVIPDEENSREGGDDIKAFFLLIDTFYNIFLSQLIDNFNQDKRQIRGKATTRTEISK